MIVGVALWALLFRLLGLLVFFDCGGVGLPAVLSFLGSLGRIALFWGVVRRWFVRLCCLIVGILKWVAGFDFGWV